MAHVCSHRRHVVRSDPLLPRASSMTTDIFLMCPRDRRRASRVPAIGWHDHLRQTNQPWPGFLCTALGGLGWMWTVGPLQCSQNTHAFGPYKGAARGVWEQARHCPELACAGAQALHTCPVTAVCCSHAGWALQFPRVFALTPLRKLPQEDSPRPQRIRPEIPSATRLNLESISAGARAATLVREVETCLSSSPSSPGVLATVKQEGGGQVALQGPPLPRQPGRWPDSAQPGSAGVCYSLSPREPFSFHSLWN